MRKLPPDGKRFPGRARSAGQVEFPPPGLNENQRRKWHAKKLIERAKDVPCADCQVRYPTCVMEFDHRPGEPFEFHISGMYWKGVAALAVEIAKCDVVCANCHRIRTHTREGAYGPRSPGV